MVKKPSPGYAVFALLIAVSLLIGSVALAQAPFHPFDTFLPIVQRPPLVHRPDECYELISNTGFETTSGWQIPITAYPAAYTTAWAHDGTRAMRTGITAAPENRYSYSDAYQVITIPADATSTTVDLWMYTMSGESSLTPIPELQEGTQFGQAPLAGDVQYVLILNAAGTWIDTIYWDRQDENDWTNLVVDLSAYRGTTIRLQFGTYNDGYDGITSMLIDDFSVVTCGPDVPPPAPSATPTQTRTPTATLLPGTCAEQFGNNSFEFRGDWYIPITVYPAAYSTAAANTGSWSMRTGITLAGDNTYSYSSAEQMVTIPGSAGSAVLDLWYLPYSGETAGAPLPPTQEGTVFGQAPLAGDVQYVLVLDEDGIWIDTLLWDLSDSGEWTHLVADLSEYRGDTISIHFGTYNDGWGGISSMFVDDASFQICPASPTPTRTVTPTPTVTRTPTQTLVPSATQAGCDQVFDNPGFETADGWYIPVTVYSAAYSTARAHAGIWSMRTGIVYSGDNIYSYSDAGQEITIDGSATSITLHGWIYTLSGEAAHVPLAPEPSGIFGREPLANDMQYILVLDQYGNILEILYWDRTDTQSWEEVSFELDPADYRGRTIKIQFGTYNDGWGGITAMYVDDLGLEVCGP